MAGSRKELKQSFGFERLLLISAATFMFGVKELKDREKLTPSNLKILCLISLATGFGAYITKRFGLFPLVETYLEANYAIPSTQKRPENR